MKTRIISGIIMALIAAGLLTVGYLWASPVILVTVAVLAVAAIFEITYNAASIKNLTVVCGVCIYAFLAVLISCLLNDKGYGMVVFVTATVIYGIYATVMILLYHNEFDLGKIALVYAMPLPFVFAFYCFGSIITGLDGIYYLLLLLNFSSVCDMGAYFTGVTIGKHKLCPQISPKKTVEGAVGGIVSSVIFTLMLSLLFNKFSATIMLLTVPFCILGMIGDLLASAIKRAVGLKDYSNLIPGHGGIMDRFDSIIMIAPSLFICLSWGLI